MPVKYEQETKTKAIRLGREHAGDYPSEYAAITAAAGRLGMTADAAQVDPPGRDRRGDRKSTRLNSSHMSISYAVFCLKKKKKSSYSLFYIKKKKRRLHN